VEAVVRGQVDPVEVVRDHPEDYLQRVCPVEPEEVPVHPEGQLAILHPEAM